MFGEQVPRQEIETPCQEKVMRQVETQMSDLHTELLELRDQMYLLSEIVRPALSEGEPDRNPVTELKLCPLADSVYKKRLIVSDLRDLVSYLTNNIQI